MTLHPTLCIAFATAIFSTPGCTPLGHGPSPVPLHASQTNQFGAELNVPIMLPLSEDASLVENGFGNTLWFRRAVTTDVEIIVETGATIGQAILPYGNVAIRKYLHRSASPDSARGFKEHMSVGLEASVGFVSLDVGLPSSLRLGKLPIWLTTHPSVGLFYYGFAYLPVGVAIQPIESLEITATMGAFLFSSNFGPVYPTAQIGSSYSW